METQIIDQKPLYVVHNSLLWKRGQTKGGLLVRPRRHKKTPSLITGGNSNVSEHGPKIGALTAALGSIVRVFAVPVPHAHDTSSNISDYWQMKNEQYRQPAGSVDKNPTRNSKTWTFDKGSKAMRPQVRISAIFWKPFSLDAGCAKALNADIPRQEQGGSFRDDGPVNTG